MEIEERNQDSENTKKEERNLGSENMKGEGRKPEENVNEEEGERNQENENTKEEGREPGDETSKKEEGESTEPSEIVFLKLRKPMLKEIRGNPVWLRLEKKYLDEKGENPKEGGKKNKIKVMEEKEKKTKQDQERKMGSEGVEEEIYLDAVEEEGETEESLIKVEKEENVESEIEVTKQTGVNHKRRNSTKTADTSCVIGSNKRDENPARQTKINEMLRRRRVRKRLTNCAQRRLRSQTGTSAGRAGCVVGQTVNLRGEGGKRDERHNYSQRTVKDTVFNLPSRMQAAVLILISTCLL